MAIKGVAISELDPLASPAVQLPGSLFEVDVLAGPVAGAYVTRRLTTEQLATYLGAGLGPNASKSLLKEFRFFRKKDRDADPYGGACFETDLDWNTCCDSTVCIINFYRESDAEPLRSQHLICVYDANPTDPTHKAWVDGSFTGGLNPSKFVPVESPAAQLANIPLLDPTKTDYPAEQIVQHALGGQVFLYKTVAAGGPFPAPTDPAGAGTVDWQAVAQSSLNRTSYTKPETDALLALKANLDSPVFTGQPAAPTPDASDISEHLATTRFVSTALASFYTSAYPLVCVRADGTLNFTFTQLHEAMAWAGAGGPGSGVYLNRPIAAANFIVMPPGTFLDLQRNVVDMAGWPVRMADKCEIRNNKLLYSGRIAPDFDPGYPCTHYIFGGTLACRLNYQLNTSATIVLDNVVVADFGQQSLGGVNAGPATSSYVGQKVILRNGAHFDVGYPPHPNTTVTVEAPATGGGGGAPVDAYTKAESDSQRQQLEADIAAAAGTQKRTTLEFRYEAGYSDTFQCTVSETMAGTYKSMGLVNTSDLAIYRNNGIAGIPLTVLAGDQIVLLINRQDLTKGAAVTLTQ